MSAVVPHLPTSPTSPRRCLWVLQWFVLNRAHAELVLADRQVERVFQEHCRTTWEEDRGQERVCYSGGRCWGAAYGEMVCSAAEGGVSFSPTSS